MAYSLVERQDFSPRCPSGGTWFACGYGTYFAGCCARNPCDVTCAQGNLYPGGFDPATYGTFPDATCGSAAKFYTCAAGNTFWGCCKSNPCSPSGCPDGDLGPAFLDNNDQRSAYHATGGTTLSSSAISTTSSSATATSNTDPLTSVSSPSSSSSSTSSASTSNQTEHKTPVAAIAGGAAGGAFVIALVIGLLIYYCCHAKKSREKQTSSMVRRQSGLPDSDVPTSNHATSQINYHPKGVVSPDVPPPGYTSPNPNVYEQQQQYYSYAHPQHHYNEPQELPIEPHSPMPMQKSAYGHTRHPSELSGDTALSELGTPASPTQAKHMSFTPKQHYSAITTPTTQYGQPSPVTPQTSFFHGPSPVSPPTAQFGHQSAEAQGRERWSAPQDWQHVDDGGRGDAGLGMRGLEDHVEFEMVGSRRVEQRGYRGV